MRAIILAAGFGTRLYPLTKDRPKPLLELAGRPVIDHVLDRVLESASIQGRALVVTNARFRADFRVWREELPKARCDRVRIVANDVTNAEDRRGAVVDLRWAVDRLEDGTGARGVGAQRAAAESDGYVVIAADNVFDFGLDGLVDVLEDSEGAGAVVAVHPPEPVEELRGQSVACVDDAGWVTRIQEKAEEPACSRRVAAIYAFRPDLPAWIDRFLEEGGDPDSPGYLLEWLAGTEASGVRVAAYSIPGDRFDVGTPERLRAARAFFRDRPD